MLGLQIHLRSFPGLGTRLPRSSYAMPCVGGDRRKRHGTCQDTPQHLPLLKGCNLSSHSSPLLTGYKSPINARGYRTFLTARAFHTLSTSRSNVLPNHCAFSSSRKETEIGLPGALPRYGSRIPLAFSTITSTGKAALVRERSSSFLNGFRPLSTFSMQRTSKLPDDRHEKNVLLRAFSTQRTTRAPEVGETGLLVRVRGRETGVPLVWLRDHCRCPLCYNSPTHQKNVDTYSLDHLAVQHSRLEGDLLSVKWQDGHSSQYSLQWLDENFNSPGARVERSLWDGARMNAQQLPSTPYEQHMNSEEGLRNTVKNIVKYGFCLVQGAPATEAGTEEVARRISFLLENVFGVLTTMVAGEIDHSDTAYTSVALGAHTDNTYSAVPPGIQTFHILHHNGEGGETLLVDGFNAGETLRRSHPSYFDTLTTTRVPHEYIEPNYHLYHQPTVLSTDPKTGAMVHLRFNPYDRAALSTVPPEDVAQFYASYQALTDVIRSPENEFWIKLRPGSVLLVDNWRVMHGRAAYTGKRVLCGCYLPRDDWTSKARTLGVL